ncbi:MAG: M14 metallopeptidase family protein [Bryobacteraceae bacterium]
MTLSRRLFAALAFPLLLAAQVPTPEQHFGHAMGADRTVLDWHKVVAYFQQLEKTSRRVKFLEYGKSTEGRPMIAAIISAPETVANLEKYLAIQRRLADPRITPPEEAARLVRDGKTVVLITCSVHATEIASTHSAVELAHRLATAQDEKTRRILDNVILVLAPSINPDGLDLVTAWYRRTLDTPFEGTSPPELYQKYIGHDNNRDWYFFTQAENRAVIEKLHNVFRPQIVYDVHQMGMFGARMFVPPWMDPIEPNIDPLIAQLCNMVGMNMAADLTAAGRKGILVNAMYDYWTPARHYQSYHGGLRILSESASVRIATPVDIDPAKIPARGNNYSPRESSWNHLEPWPGGRWTLRDIVTDQLIAMESLLDTAALRRDLFLKGFYDILRRAATRTNPYAFVIPAAQDDPGAARRLLETMDFALVEVERASAPFTAAGREYPAGSYVIRMQQPYSAFAKALLERQKYPDLREYPGGPPKRPYDVAAHTLPLLLGVAVDTIDAPFEARLERTREFRFPARNLSGSDSDSWRAVTAAWRNGRPVFRHPSSGDFAVGSSPSPEYKPLPEPRIGVYKPFVPSMDEGWTRWILEHFGWRYTSLLNSDIRAGNLRSRFDVIVFADISASVLENGHARNSMPEEFTGGLGTEGAAALREFLAAGGKLLFFNRSGEYAARHLGIPVRNALAGVPPRDFYCPGSLLNVRVDSPSPLTLGLPASFTLWNETSPLWEPQENGAAAVLRYAPSGVLASGWLLGESHIAGKPALLDVPSGQGRVVLFGFRPQYRGQSWLTLKLLFNALVM